jgi:hypothetical protein
LLAHGWWFSPGTPASSTTKTGRHNIAEILLKVALNTKIKSNQIFYPILTAFNKLMIVLEVAHDNSKMLKLFTGQILNILDLNNE